ncbi:MAG: LON peptidase substrate-binding domain-containing protein, partial [Alphaproteobacteria bacterium]
MTRSVFNPRFEDLPRVIPIFPLTGALLLPTGKLPLNIFEPRYLAMVRDALADKQRIIGMVQPRTPDLDDNRGASGYG